MAPELAGFQVLREVPGEEQALTGFEGAFAWKRTDDCNPNDRFARTCDTSASRKSCDPALHCIDSKNKHQASDYGFASIDGRECNFVDRN